MPPIGIMHVVFKGQNNYTRRMKASLLEDNELIFIAWPQIKKQIKSLIAVRNA